MLNKRMMPNSDALKSLIRHTKCSPDHYSLSTQKKYKMNKKAALTKLKKMYDSRIKTSTTKRRMRMIIQRFFLNGAFWIRMGHILSRRLPYGILTYKNYNCHKCDSSLPRRPQYVLTPIFHGVDFGAHGGILNK
jgi:hypothetical protein